MQLLPLLRKRLKYFAPKRQIMTKKESLSIAQILLVSFLILLIISCSSYKKTIRVDPTLTMGKSNIDTIAVFSDALVGITAGNDFYSANSSYLLDTLILTCVQEVLQGKGYGTKQINPLFSGSFMDTFQYVPVKKFNAEQIEPTRLPFVFQNELSINHINAFARTCRRLYLQTIYNNSNQLSLKISNPVIKSDLDTLRNFINCDHVLFIFHQAKLIDPNITDAISFGMLFVPSVVRLGITIGFATQMKPYYTYMILMQLSTGNIVWSNYSNLNAAPTLPLFEISKKRITSLSGYVKSKETVENVLWTWQEFNLEAFPMKNDSKMFFGHKKKYPSGNYFQIKLPKFFDLSNSKLKKRIDSTITAFSISEDATPEIPHDSMNDGLEKGRLIEAIQPAIDSVMEYLQYAYYSRLRFRPTLEGETTIQFIITTDGCARKIEILKSSINDRILEYVFVNIIRNFNFKNTIKNYGTALITKRLVFTYSKK
jgi:hypothetical protein